MGLLTWWRTWRLRRKLARMGRGCRAAGVNIEIKGHVEAGDCCELRGNVVLRTHGSGKIVLGDGVLVSDYVLFQVSELAEVGDNAYIGPYVVVRDTNHVFQGTDVHWRLTPLIVKGIRIGANSYLGAGTYIMPGVSIGPGAVVAPGSIVNRDIPPEEVWAGAPARKVAHRTEPEQRTSLRRQLDLVRMFGFGSSEPEEDAAGPESPRKSDPA